MLELLNENAQNNGFSMDYVMLHWESDGSMKIARVYDWRCAFHPGEKVETM